MENLAKGKCVPCRAGAPKVTPAETEYYLKGIPRWQVVNEDKVNKLERSFETRNYARAIKLVNMIADAANEEDHHPVMLVEFSKVTVWWWTHKIEGLHRNDFIMATKTDELFAKLKY